MTTQERGRLTREAILQAAGVVFSRNSYAAATLGEVISLAGITQGALYFHFDSKHDLASAVIERQHQTSIASTETASGGRSGLTALVTMSGELARQIATDPVVQAGLRLSTESADAFPDMASSPYQSWASACARWVRQAMADGDVDPDANADAIGYFVAAAFTGTQVFSRATTGWTDLIPRLEEMWRFVLQAIVLPEKLHAVQGLSLLVAEGHRPVSTE